MNNAVKQIEKTNKKFGDEEIEERFATAAIKTYPDAKWEDLEKWYYAYKGRGRINSETVEDLGAKCGEYIKNAATKIKRKPSDTAPRTKRDVLFDLCMKSSDLLWERESETKTAISIFFRHFHKITEHFSGNGLCAFVECIEKSVLLGLPLDGSSATPTLLGGGKPTFIVGYEGLLRHLREKYQAVVNVECYTVEDIAALGRKPKAREVAPILEETNLNLCKKIFRNFGSDIFNPDIEESEIPNALAIIQVCATPCQEKSNSDLIYFDNFLVCDLVHKVKNVVKRSMPWRQHPKEMLKKTAIKAFMKLLPINNSGLGHSETEHRRAIYNEVEDGVIN